MGLKIAIIVAGISVLSVTSLLQIEPKRDKMEFNRSVAEVTNALEEMDSLLKKVPSTLMVNYFVNNEGYLYLSNQRVGKVRGAERNASIRNDMFFEKFQAHEVDRFFELIHFLKANGIGDCHLEPAIKMFIFSFKNENTYRTPSLRFLMYVSAAEDTTNRTFRERFRILDRNPGVILVAPIPVDNK